MKNILRRSLSLLLALCFVLGCTAMGVTAAEATVEKEYVFEAESTAYKAYNTSGAELTGASKPGVKYYGSNETGDCIHFTNSGLESISYTLNVEKEGSYDLSIAYRLNWNYYAKGYISVNGVATEKYFTTRSTTADDNKDNNRISIVYFEEVELNAGDNVITLNVTEKASDANKTQIMLDKFVLVEIDPFKYEAEATPFTAIDSNGDTIATSNEKSTWAWSLKLGTTGLKGDLSHDLAYFRSGGIGGTINFTIDVPTAGEYGLTAVIRPNSDSNCTFRVLVNGEQVGHKLSAKDTAIINGIPSENNTLRNFEIGNAAYTAGENTVTFEILDYKNSDASLNNKTGFAIDYFRLGDPIDESTLSSTVVMNQLSIDESKEFNACYQTRINADDNTKIDIRTVMIVPEADIADKDSIIATITFSDGTVLENHTVSKVYTAIDAAIEDLTDTYTAPEGYVIFGVVVTGAPAGTAATDASWVIE